MKTSEKKIVIPLLPEHVGLSGIDWLEVCKQATWPHGMGDTISNTTQAPPTPGPANKGAEPENTKYETTKMSTELREGQVLIPNARIGYPKLFTPEAIKGMADSRPRYGCAIYLPKSDESTRAKINEIIREIVKEKLKGVMPQQKDLCYKDGDEEGDENTAGYVIISANRQESQGRPTVIGRKREPLTQEDAVIYAGCRCNFLVGFFVPKGWKKIACGLEIVQFRGDDEPFGAGRPPVDVMPDMADEDDGDDGFSV